MVEKKKNRGMGFGIWGGILVLVCLAFASLNVLAAEEKAGTASIPVESAGAKEQGTAKSDSGDFKPRDKARDVAHMKLIIMALLMCISTLFLLFLLITMVRISRMRRKQLKIGQKGEKTDASDLWSRYRLKEEDKEI